jgi:hypothetical protein
VPKGLRALTPVRGKFRTAASQRWAARTHKAVPRDHRQVSGASGDGWCDSRRPHQRDGVAMPRELLFLGIIPPPQGQHFAGTLDHDGLPPAVFQRLSGENDVGGMFGRLVFDDAVAERRQVEPGEHRFALPKQHGGHGEMQFID